MGFAPLQNGDLLNERYKILEALGQGGMGTVYKAEHVRLHSIVAVKEIHGLGGDEAQNRLELDRCEHEARFLVRLNHPNLPKVTDAFIENDCFYLVMEYIEGVTLETRLNAAQGRPLDVLQSVEWGLQIADVLAYLHTQEPPIIFRDLKPSNVMLLPDSSIKLIDFGIARLFQPGASKDTSLLGSVGYSPPEQFGKGQTDARSDVYAFGATLHHLLTGRDPSLQPFKFPPARTFNPLVPDLLSHLLDVCLALDPSDRPETIHVVAVQLLSVREELVTQRARAMAQQAAFEASAPHLSPLHGSPGYHASGPVREKPGLPEPPPTKEIPPVPIRVTSASQASRRPTPASSSSSPRSAAWLLVPVLLVVIGGGAAVAVMSGRNAHRDGPKPPIITDRVIVPKTPESDNLNGTDQSGTVPTQPDPNNTAVPIAPPPTTPLAHNDVSLQSAYLNIADDTLPIVVSGSIKSHGGTSVKLAIYFFDAKGQPIEAIDTSDPAYVNEQNYLCTYKPLAIPSDDYAVKESLTIPTRLLTGAKNPTPFTYQVMLFEDNKPLPLYKSGSIELPPAAYGGTVVSMQSALPNPGPTPPAHSVIFGGGRTDN
jgi:serine/threonine protein kinase